MFAVIVNPVSGGGEAVRLAIRISERIAAMGQESRLFETSGDGDAARQTRAAVEAGCAAVVCIGGDGTICEAAGELCHRDATFYVVPGGTGNDFARAFHLPKDPMAAFESQLAGEPIQIDCGRMNGKSFLNVSGSGFDVAVLEKTEELKAVYPGEKAYRKAVLSVLGRYKAFEAELSIDGGETTHEACTIVEIANGQCIGGGMRVAPDAKLDDGYFDVVVVKKVPRLLIPLLLPMFMMGWHTKNRAGARDAGENRHDAREKHDRQSGRQAAARGRGALRASARRSPHEKTEAVKFCQSGIKKACSFVL